MSLPQDRVEIDPKGDLILHVSSETTAHFLRVSSKALCLASPVFRTMLESPLFLEGRALQSASTESPFQMQLHDDDYESLLTVVNTVHLKARKIPTTLSLEQFYQLAIVCDKYDVAEIFVPWVKIWTAILGKTPRRVACQRWLVISWVFRMRKTFEAVTKEMIYDASLSGDFPAEGDDSVETGNVPSRVFESVRGMQQKTAFSLVSLATQEFDRYKTSTEAGRTICQVNSDYSQEPCYYRGACDIIALGGLMRDLFVAGLWPITMDTSSSIRSILKVLTSMKNHCRNLPGALSAHYGCGLNPRLGSAAKEILAAIKGLEMSDFCHPDMIFFPDDV